MLETKDKLKYSLGLEIENGQIELQHHIAEKILNFSDKLDGLKQIQAFLVLLNYARKFIPSLSKLVGPLYEKISKNRQRYFNQEDVELVKRIKEHVKKIKPLELSLKINYIIIKCDGSKEGWEQ